MRRVGPTKRPADSYRQSGSFCLDLAPALNPIAIYCRQANDCNYQIIYHIIRLNLNIFEIRAFFVPHYFLQIKNAHVPEFVL